MCQPVTSNLHRHRLRSDVRGGLIVPPTKTARYAVHAALLSLGRQREMRYLHHYATTNSAMSFHRQLKTELYIYYEIVHKVHNKKKMKKRQGKNKNTK